MARKRASRAPHAASAPPRTADPSWDEATYRRLRDELRLRREELAARHEIFKDAQRERTFSQDEYESIFDLGPTPCLILDSNGVVHRSNRAAVGLLGYDRKRLRTTPFMVLVAETDRRRFLDHMRRCRRSTSEAVVTTLMLRTRTGDDAAVELCSHALHGEPTEPDTYHTAIIDLRERRRAERERSLAREQHRRLEQERQLMRAASAAKDQFLAVLSHELRTPLTPVLLATSSWKDDPTLPSAIRDVLTMVHRNVSLEVRLIDDLLDMTRVTQGKITLQPAVVDSAPLITEVLAALSPEAHDAKLRIETDLQARRHVCGDPLRFRQVVTNLLRNAIRFTPAGGRITVETRDVEENRMALTVTDTGVGFDALDATKIFEPFAQSEEGTGRGGLGLGLAITRGIVEAHGGTVHAFSPGRDQGARFVVTIPSTQSIAQPADTAVPTPGRVRAHRHPASDSLHILLVEDHVDTSAALSYVLQQEGYTVRCAHSVAQALEAASAEDVDVIVSDLGLPDGSGLDLMRAIKTRKPMRGIALTGYGRREDLDDTHAAGFDRHLTKPVDPSTLIAAIESLRHDAA